METGGRCVCSLYNQLLINTHPNADDDSDDYVDVDDSDDAGDADVDVDENDCDYDVLSLKMIFPLLSKHLPLQLISGRY